ncbi:MAG: glycosyltransferase family 39 protein [Candidatus Omnitrophota bacterium]|nr:glycosyltransferase family 39 protein [Candidatus Omnitrophota bacterium]
MRFFKKITFGNNYLGYFQWLGKFYLCPLGYTFLYHKKNYLLLGIIFFGLILRLWGINFGLPHQFHQDEPIVVNHALAYGTGDLNPHFFAIPPLTSYLLFFIYGIYFAVGWLLGIFQNIDTFAFSFFNDPSTFYILGRLFIGVIPGTLAILFTYKLYRKIANSSGGALFACAIVAFNFLSVADSHYIYTDMLMSLFVIVSISQLVKTYNLSTLKNYILSGIFIGLAAGIKYNAIVLMAPFLIAHLFVWRDKKTQLINRKVLLGIISLLVTFLLINPFALFDFKFFIKSFATQAGASGYVGWLHHILYSLKESIGMPFFILGLAGMLLLLLRDRRKGYLLFLFPFLFYLHLVFISQRFPRYVIPLIPFFAIGSAWLIFEYLIPRINTIFAKRFVVALLSLFFIPLLIKSIKADILFSSSDTRVEAAEWIKAHLDSKDRIAVDHTFFRPTIIQNEQQLKDKYGLLGRQQGLERIKDNKFRLMLEAQKQTIGYYLYFLSRNPQKQGQFLATMPALSFDLNILKSMGINYIVINYADRQKGTECFYQSLRNNAKLIISFSPYSDSLIRFSYDMIANTSLPLLSKEIFSRDKSGPALEIYQLIK